MTGDALQGNETATQLRVRDGETQLTDGPFVEAKEYLAGYYMIEAPDLDAALAWAAKVPNAAYGTVEVRPVLEIPAAAHGVNDVERAFREEGPAVLATLIRHVGDIGLAEDALQDAFAAAVATWPRDGVPASPGAWITTDGAAQGDRSPAPRPRRRRPGRPPAGPRERDAAAHARGAGGVRGRRRPAAADVHLLPPGACRATRRWRSPCACSAA